MKDWYALSHSGEIVSAGRHESFGDADDTNYVWLTDAEGARKWLSQLAGMFGATVDFANPGQAERVALANASVAAALAQADDPVSIVVSEEVDVELRGKEEKDHRVLVGRKGWGQTTVNYTHEGLIVDVYSEDDLEPVFSIALPSEDLEASAESPPKVGCDHCGTHLKDGKVIGCPNGAEICQPCFEAGVY